jgi:hypothetical protein
MIESQLIGGSGGVKERNFTSPDLLIKFRHCPRGDLNRHNLSNSSSHHSQYTGKMYFSTSNLKWVFQIFFLIVCDSISHINSIPVPLCLSTLIIAIKFSYLGAGERKMLYGRHCCLPHLHHKSVRRISW